MIYITCGTCGTSKGYKTSADGAISLPAPEEARLVSRGVAEYVTRPVTNDAPGTSPEPLVNAAEDIEEPDAGEENADEVAQLERMTRPELEQMASDLGLDASAAKNKHDLAVLIAAADAPETDDTEAL